MLKIDIALVQILNTQLNTLTGTFRNIPEHPGTSKNKNNFHENK